TLIVELAIQHLHRLGVVLKLGGEEEERAVPAEGAADGAAELLAAADLLPPERVPARQVAIAKQVEAGPVDLVGSRLGGQIDDAAGGAAELGRESAAEHLKLLQRFHAEAG